MKKQLLAALTIVGLAAPLSAQAQISYNYIEGGLVAYPSYRFPGGSFRGEDFLGLRAGASFEITNDIFTFGQFRYLTDDFDMTNFHWGGGYVLPLPLPNEASVWAGAAVEYVHVNPPSGSSDGEFGFSIRGGGRYIVHPDVEVGVDGRVVRYGGDIGETFFGVAGRGVWTFNQNLGLVGELDIEDGEPGVFFGARVTF